MAGKTTGVPADLLTGPPDREVGRLEAAVEEVSKIDLRTPEARAHVKRHIAMLKDSEVWQLMKAYYRGEQARLIEAIATLSNPNQVLKDSGELKMLLQLLKWPETMLNTITAMDTHAAQAKEREDARGN